MLRTYNFIISKGYIMKIKKWIKKYCYIVIPIITILVYILIYFLSLKIEFFRFNLNDDSSTIIQIAGTLIGFLLTAITIFLSLPKDTDLMKRIKKYKHHTIFARCVVMGLIFSTISILLWIFNVNHYILIMFFGLSLEETLMSAYYIYKLSIYNFQ